MSLHRSVAFSTTSLAAFLAFAVSASAQGPWNLTIRPSTTPLEAGQCTPVYLELRDASGRESPRNPAGMRVSMADFDMSVAGGGKVVGRYDGASAWSACACPASAGVSATITATYPARLLAEKARVPRVAFQSTLTVPVVAGNNSGVPIGCETFKTTTVPAGSPVPWTVTLTSGVSALPIGACSPIHIDLRDATGKEYPRNPAGLLVSLADFDMTVTAAGGGAVAGQYSDASNWSACACQGAAVGSLATITASYPGRALAEPARVPGVAFQSSMSIPLAAARGTFNPPACAAPTVAAGAPVVGAPISGTPRTAGAPPVAAPPAPVAQPVAIEPAPAKTSVPLLAPSPGPAPIGVTVTGTPASATLAWQPVAGVASYVVTRQQANVPPTSQTLAATNTGMYDSGLRPATAYTYTVRAIQADGREGKTDVLFTTPPAVNPSGFTARQTGDGQVQLSWQPVNDASYYVLLGPGSSFGGVKVSGATSFTVTGVPAGLQTWAVASYYEPGPVSTVGTEFSTAQLTVAAAPAPTPPPPPAPAVSLTAKWTAFKPAIHGFRFGNDFSNSFMPPPINMVTSGLCGGMSYAVLDWYNAGRPILSQTYRPANNTPLQQYLYGRQVTSLLQNLDKWAEVGLNPDGARNTEFFNWGLTARLTELRSFIDRGVPVPLGLKGIGAILEHSDHQVLAIGYDMGSAGNLGELKIYLLDPNFPKEIVTLVPDIAENLFYLLEHSDNRWRTYFVDGKYAPMTPPNIVNPSYPSDGLVHELLFTFYTGPAFDLRGGADHVDLTITLSDNTSQSYTNISQDGRWLKSYFETAQVILSRPVPRAMIRSITISTNAPGGFNSANWDMGSWWVEAVVGGGDTQLLYLTKEGYMFTGVRPSLVIQIP